MRFLLVAILLILAGCSNVSSPYLITKDRVDQEIEGNRGYLLGTPPPAPARRDVPKRTLIGIDVEIPILPGEKGYKTSYKGPVIREEDIKMNLRLK
jgi:hypothetical protein